MSRYLPYVSGACVSLLLAFAACGRGGFELEPTSGDQNQSTSGTETGGSGGGASTHDNRSSSDNDNNNNDNNNNNNNNNNDNDNDTNTVVDRTPDPFTISDVGGRELNVPVVVSFTPSGFDSTLRVTVSPGELSTDGGVTWVASAEVLAGTEVRLRVVSPNDFGQFLRVEVTLGDLAMEFLVSTLLAPCLGAAIGDTCETGPTGSIGAPLYAGTLGTGAEESRYMTTPAGCTDVDGNDSLNFDLSNLMPNAAYTPACSGAQDFVVKSWGPIGAFQTANDPESGELNTIILAGDPENSVLPTASGDHPAAAYCAFMDYGGYADWHLPSERELALLYCSSNGGEFHDPSRPANDPDCASLGGGGPSGALSGFGASSYYHSSTELTENTARQLDFHSGVLDDYFGKSGAMRVRCMRRFSVPVAP